MRQLEQSVRSHAGHVVCPASDFLGGLISSVEQSLCTRAAKGGLHSPPGAACSAASGTRVRVHVRRWAGRLCLLASTHLEVSRRAPQQPVDVSVHQNPPASRTGALHRELAAVDAHLVHTYWRVHSKQNRWPQPRALLLLLDLAVDPAQTMSFRAWSPRQMAHCCCVAAPMPAADERVLNSAFTAELAQRSPAASQPLRL
jgi:hypothetical protein